MSKIGQFWHHQVQFGDQKQNMIRKIGDEYYLGMFSNPLYDTKLIHSGS